MKNTKFNSLFVLLAFCLFFASCKEEVVVEDPKNEITITIEEPVDSENIAMANCGSVHVHVDFAASIENHQVEVILHPEGDVSNKVIDYDHHDHDQKITFEQEIDLCMFDAGTCFHLEVFACIDHDCAEKASAEAEFCLN